MNTTIASILLYAALPLAAGGATNRPEVPPRDSSADDESINSSLDFFLQPLEKNPAPQEVELGRQLFFDPRLSSNNSISCASCHQPAKAWTDGLPRAKGLLHHELKRNTPSLLNIFYSKSFFWDGRAKDLDELAMIPVQELQEMGQDPNELVLKLNRVPGYVRQFLEVYGLAGITPSNISKAISAFIKSGIAADPAPIDRFYKDRSALGPAAQRGLRLFVGKARCNMCHVGPIFTDNNFHSIGLKPAPGLDDVGRYQYSPDEHSWRAFKTPTLRNLGLTAPYMHDGSLKTLAEVVEFYDRGGDEKEKQDVLIKPLGLTSQEKEDLVAFLEALTSPQAAFKSPDLPTEEAPQSLSQAVSWDIQRLKMISFSLEQNDLHAVFANAMALRENLALERTLTPSRRCLEALGRDAWDLAHMAQSAPPQAKLREKFTTLKMGYRQCHNLSAQDRGDWSTEQSNLLRNRVEAITRELAGLNKIIPSLKAGCLDDVPIQSLTQNITDGKFEQDEIDLIRDSIRSPLANFYEYSAVLAGNPAVCEQFQLPRTYYGIALSGNFACRLNFHINSLSHALIAQSPEFKNTCKQSLIETYHDVSDQSAAGACAVIEKNFSSPRLCSMIIPAYLSPNDTDQCEDQFKVFAGQENVGACKALPAPQNKRCRDLTRLKKAASVNNPGLCADSELCWAIMGNRGKSAGRVARKIKEDVCRILRQSAERKRDSLMNSLRALKEELLDR